VVARKTKKSRRKPKRRRKTSAKAPSSWPLKLLWGLILSLLLVSVFLWAYLSYYNAQEHCVSNLETQDIRVNLNSPAYLSVGDEEEIQVTLTNEHSDTVSITLKVVYTGTALFCTADEERHVIDFGPMQPQERATRRIKLSFPLCVRRFALSNWPGQQVDFSLWLALDGNAFERIGLLSLSVMPIARARTLGKLVQAWMIGLTVWSGKELWDQVKKTGAAEDKSKA